MAKTENVTVVTGATGALGTELVRVLLNRGERVVALGRADTEQRLAAVEGAQEQLLAFDLDVGDLLAWGPVLEQIRSRMAEPTGAVLVAGGWRGGLPFHEPRSTADWEPMLQGNLETAQVSLRALLPGMVQKQKGSIVLVASRAAVRPWESANAAAYAAAKAALLALGQAVAAEVLPYGVRVNSVLPSTIDTGANRQAMPSADPSQWVTPRSLAEVILFLLGDASRDISGAVLPVYGRA